MVLERPEPKAVQPCTHTLWKCRSVPTRLQRKPRLRARASGTTTGRSDVIASQLLCQSPHPDPPSPAQRDSPSQPARRALSEKEAECGPPTSSRFPGGPTLPNQDWGHQLGLHKLPPRSTLKPFEELIKQVNDINTIVEGILNYLFK